MKITNSRNNLAERRIENVPAGSVVQFNKSFNQNYPPNELFLVADPGSYKEYCGSLDFPRAKVCVVNLSCGKMSFVMCNRECVIMDAEVTVDGPVS